MNGWQLARVSFLTGERNACVNCQVTGAAVVLMTGSKRALALPRCGAGVLQTA